MQSKPTLSRRSSEVSLYLDTEESCHLLFSRKQKSLSNELFMNIQGIRLSQAELSHLSLYRVIQIKVSRHERVSEVIKLQANFGGQYWWARCETSCQDGDGRQRSL
ncbi:hypothetical protein FGO68_gene2734 [Halteria grandinella]|uniref:Uncharacterized protein n=1 Tax=Halteria grandinella TaxID=5974 RepID=A0A8J8P4Q7_HALGN|nr:hypothetical protein FGO68_gene2734 [Halteria grandinella]